jgi:hypothetical protein
LVVSMITVGPLGRVEATLAPGESGRFEV